MPYTKTPWVNTTTPINATNLNKIEQGIYDVHPIANVATLEAATGYSDGATVYLQGYYSANGEGAGPLKRNASSSATRDGGIIFTSADGAAGSASSSTPSR